MNQHMDIICAKTDAGEVKKSKVKEAFCNLAHLDRTCESWNFLDIEQKELFNYFYMLKYALGLVFFAEQ